MDIFFIKIQIIVNKQLFILKKWPFIVKNNNKMKFSINNLHYMFLVLE